MEDPFQAVATGTDDDGGFLPAGGAPAQVGQVVCHNLQGVEQVIQVLDFSNRPQAPQGHADGLAEDGGFTDAGIRDTQGTIFFLKAAEALVDIAQLAHVFTKGNQAGLAFEGGIKGSVNHFKAHHCWRALAELRCNCRHLEGAFFAGGELVRLVIARLAILQVTGKF